jgi:tryptophanyl-tRNA synthetase
MGKKRILSGMRPSGRLHLGHLEGVLKNWVKLQDEYDCFFFVADWHALTDNLDTGQRKENIFQMLIDWLSVGIDPSKSTLFIQSEIPEHAELHILLSMITPVPWLERCPTFKDRVGDISSGEAPSYGLLGYPVLQTSDIIMYKADFVPVGEDQLAHLEISREIVRRFNSVYGKVFPEPQPMLTSSPKLLGLDGRKMSKSYRNSILLSDDKKAVKEKVKTMITDPARVYRKDKGHPDVCSVFTYRKQFAPDSLGKIEKACRGAEIGCTECKEKLADSISLYLEPIQRQRKKYEMEFDSIRDIVSRGAEEARKVARKTMSEVRAAMGLSQI